MKIFDFRFSNHGKGALSIFFAGALFLIDQSTRYRFGHSEYAYCNAAGPLGVSISGSAVLATSLVVLLVFGYVAWIYRARIGMVAPVMILAGGVSNVVDRALFGCVRDYQVFGWFPAFNLGDVYLSIGAVMLFAWLYLAEKKEKG